MRTVDATLTAAFLEGTGRPYLMGFLGYAGGFVLHSQDVTSYKLTGTSLEIEMPYTGDIGGDQTHVWLERGLTIAGVKYSLTTGRFAIQSQHYQANGRQVIKGTLFPKQYYSTGAHATYKTVLDAFCAAFGKTAVYRDPAAAWLNYTFMPLGKSIILNDANSFASLLRQKYLIFLADRGNEEILFYSCAPGLGAAADITYTAAADFHIERTRHSSRKYIWRDELEAVHTDGSATDPIHNLGFLWSTDPAPAMHSAPSLWHMTQRPDLRILDGDIVAVSAFGSTVKSFALVTEEYIAPDKGHPVRVTATAASPGRDGPHPRWTTTIIANEVFGNTAGGAMPSTIERVSNYTPLNTSMFGGILSANENNLQAAMDKLDDHSHPSILPAHGLNGVIAAGATMFTPPFYYGLQTSRFNFTVPKAGRLSLLSIWTNSAQPATGTLVVTVAVNNAASALTITVPAGSAAAYFRDTTNTVTLAAGDTVSIDLTNNAAANSAQVNGLTICFYPANP